MQEKSDRHLGEEYPGNSEQHHTGNYFLIRILVKGSPLDKGNGPNCGVELFRWICVEFIPFYCLRGGLMQL
jgi:hypothetical protein